MGQNSMATETHYKLFGRYRGLTGARLAIAKKVFVQDVLFGVALAVVVLANDMAHTNFNLSVVVLGLLLAWIVLRIVRKQTFWQLRLEELRISKTVANDALNELNNLADNLNKSIKGND